MKARLFEITCRNHSFAKQKFYFYNYTRSLVIE